MNESKSHHIVSAPTFFGHKPTFNMCKYIQLCKYIQFMPNKIYFNILVDVTACSARALELEDGFLVCFPLFFPFI